MAVKATAGLCACEWTALELRNLLMKSSPPIGQILTTLYVEPLFSELDQWDTPKKEG